jgi:virginiamycin B lyase
VASCQQDRRITRWGCAMFRGADISRISALSLLAVALWLPSAKAADNSGVVQGVVKDSSGAGLSGAFVKLKEADRHLTFMVISQAQGRYAADHLPAGQYLVQGIGNGYQSEPSRLVDLTGDQTLTVDLSLTAPQAPTQPPSWTGTLADQSRRMSGGAEKSRSALPPMPDGEGKRIIETRCVVCHEAPQRLLLKGADRSAWERTISEMRDYSRSSTVAKDLTDAEAKLLLDYLSANFSPSSPGGNGTGRSKADPGSRLPRTLLDKKTPAYRVVEYELPPNAGAHDITVDSKGIGWVCERAGRIGRLDPQTFVFTPVSLPPAASKRLFLQAIQIDPKDRLWFVDGGPNHRWLTYDVKSGEFNVFVAPKAKMGFATGNTMRMLADGSVWLTGNATNQIVRLDPSTHKFTAYEVPAGIKRGGNATPYGMAVSGDGKIWFAEHFEDLMGRLDPATGKIDEFPIPVPGPVMPRRMAADAEGNLWVGLHEAGKLMKIDYKTTKMTIYTPPTQPSGPYSVSVDLKHNLIWFSEHLADKIARFDPRTETYAEFPLPHADSDVRRIEVDQNNPNRVWYSGNDSSRMGYVQLLNGE